MAVIMDGKALAAKVKEEVRAEVAAMTKKPGLAVVLVGDDPASQVYAAGKKRDCQQCGIYSEEYVLPAASTQEELLELLRALNDSPSVDGILLQLPLPAHMDEGTVLRAIDPGKDVDGFHPYNMGLLMEGNAAVAPCTPGGVMRFFREYGIDPKGKLCTVVGRSNIVGKPMALLLMQAHGTVTICHSKTPNLKACCLQADILVAAVGRPGLITGDMVKEGAVVIDVGTTRDENGVLRGDVDFSSVEPKASYITPVPGGVGPVTRAILLENVLRAARSRGKK